LDSGSLAASTFEGDEKMGGERGEGEEGELEDYGVGMLQYTPAWYMLAASSASTFDMTSSMNVTLMLYRGVASASTTDFW
jgi:hypothetical protein